MKHFIIITALFLAQIGTAQTTITVTVTDISTNEGKVAFGLYTEDTFIKAAPNYSASAKVENHTAKVIFENIPEGEYAISCYQDTNGNDQFDFEPNGMPAEPYGISNNAVGYYGPPSWADAKFTVADEPVNLEIQF